MTKSRVFNRVGQCEDGSTPRNTRRPAFRVSGRSRRRSRRGATLIEFALVITSLMLLTLGLVQFAVLANTSMSLSQLAREAARYGAVNGNYKDDAKIKEYIQALTPSYNIAYSDLAIQISPTDPAVRAQYFPLRVSLTYNMGKKMFLPANFMGVRFFSGNKTVSGTYMME